MQMDEKSLMPKELFISNVETDVLQRSTDAMRLVMLRQNHI